jgi:hypothetical protein
MSCSAVASAAFLWLAASNPAAATAIPTAAPAAAPASVANEPLFADIIKRAAALKVAADGFKSDAGAIPDQFQQDIAELSALDMKGHLTLKERGTDGDLKCILKGISEDLPLKLDALIKAATPSARKAAAIDLAYLLNDNVEVITAPPAPEV